MRASKVLRAAAKRIHDNASIGRFHGMCNAISTEAMFGVGGCEPLPSSCDALLDAQDCLSLLSPGTEEDGYMKLTAFWMPLDQEHVERRILTLLLAADIAESEGH